MRIYNSMLAIDVGMKDNGWCFIDEVGEDSGHFKRHNFITFYKTVKDLMDESKPQLIIVGKPNRISYNVITAHSKLIGILCLLAEKYFIPLIELNDTTARAACFPGKGTQKKEYFKQFFDNINSDDEMDAIIMARAGWKILNE